MLFIYEEKKMAFKTTPIDFLESFPVNLNLKKSLMKKYAVEEDDIDNPMWHLMMTEYVSELYSLIHT